MWCPNRSPAPGSAFPPRLEARCGGIVHSLAFNEGGTCSKCPPGGGRGCGARKARSESFVDLASQFLYCFDFSIRDSREAFIHAVKFFHAGNGTARATATGARAGF